MDPAVRRHRFTRLVVGTVAWSAALAAVALGVAASARAFASAGAFDAPVAARLEALPDFAPLAMRSTVLARDGSVIAALREEDRERVTLADVPKHVVDAVLAAEDAYFYVHHGIDVRGAMRAAVRNTSEGRVAQGGSTITQQLVKNALLTSERDLDRKLHEAVLAVRAEREMSKDEILERYLNTVYFGQGAYGVEAAAERFFGKSARDLDLGEAALLAGLIANPEGANPFTNAGAAQRRRAYVLDQLARGHVIDAATRDALSARPLPETPHAVLPEPKDHFVEEVRMRLLDDERLGPTRDDRRRRLFRGGLRVHTTIDPRLQALGRDAIAATVPPSEFTAVLTAIDPGTGEVVALVDPRPFEDEKFNLVTQGARQPGSAFKVATLAAALEAGYSPEDLVDATAPCAFLQPLPPPNDVWNVDNYEGGGGAIGTLRDATVRSYNCAYARMVQGLGPDRVVEMAARLGIQRRLDTVASITLGTEEVSPMEMATLFATIAADGVRRDPVFVSKVVDREGNVLLRNERVGQQVIAPQIARTLTDVLRGVVDSGTGRRASIGRPAAGKTGTSQGWRDAWFGGFTPQLATVVWMGHPAAQVSMTNVGGTRVAGGTFPATIWGRFMGPALAGFPVVDFVAPDRALWPPPALVGEGGRVPQPGAEQPLTIPVGLATATIPASGAPRDNPAVGGGTAGGGTGGTGSGGGGGTGAQATTTSTTVRPSTSSTTTTTTRNRGQKNKN